MMIGVRRMLHDGRFVSPWCCLGGGEMLLVSGRGSATRFPDIVVSAGTVVTAGTGVIIHHAVYVQFVEFVLRVDKVLSESAS